MGSLSLFHWVIVLAIVVLLFGAGRLPNVMGDFAKGIKAFRAGLREDDSKPGDPPALPQDRTPPVAGPTTNSEHRAG